MRVLSLLVVLTAWCALTKADKPNNCSKGVIQPYDPYFLDGQNITLTCWRKNNVTPRDLYFTRGSQKDRLPEEFYMRNDTHLMLQFPVTAEDVSNFRGNSIGYYCHDKRSKKDVCIQNVFVEIDFYPRIPVDVKCASYNWETMTCEWDLDVVYNHPIDYEVSCDFVARDSEYVDTELLYQLDENAELWGECPNQTSTSCYWDHDNYSRAKLYIVMVRVTNTVLNITTRTEALTFKSKDIVKPAPVDPANIAISFLDKPDTVHIQWNHSQQFRNFVFMLQIVSLCDQEKIQKIAYIPDQRRSYNEQTPAQMNLTGLSPNTEYTVNLTARPLGGTGPWSEATEILFTTLSDVLKGSPYTRNGLFEENCGVPCSTIEDCKNFKVYFKPLTECEIFSNTTEYTVSTQLLNTTLNTSDFWTVSEVPWNQTSSIELRAISDEGVSTNYSSLTIHPEFERPIIKRDLVIHYNPTTGDCTARVVVLREDVRFSNLSHVIVWCYSGGEPYCRKPIDWYELRENETSMKLPKHCKVKYRVGISTLGHRADTSEVIATPIHWQPCMYEEGKVPKVPLSDVDTFETGVDKKVKVSWTPYSCNAKDSNYVDYYEVSHCGVAEEDQNCTCTDKLVIHNVSSLHTSKTLQLNDSGQYWCVWVRAKTVAGFGPKNAEGKMFNVTGYTAVSSDYESRTIIIASVVGGLGGLAVIVVMGFCFRRCYKRFKKMFVGPEIADISINLTDNGTALQYQGIDTNGETEITIEEEAEPLISDSGTGSLASKISTDVPETERERNGSDDSGVDRLGNDETLVALLEENPAGSGNTYGAMPDLEEYDFNSSTGLSSAGPCVNKTEQIRSETRENGVGVDGADIGSAELRDTQENGLQNKQGTGHDMHIEDPQVKIHIKESETCRHSNEVVVNMDSTVDPSQGNAESIIEGSRCCQSFDLDNAKVQSADNFAEAVSERSPLNCVEVQSEILHNECTADDRVSKHLKHEVNDLGDFDNARHFSSQNKSDEVELKEGQEEDPSQPSFLSGSNDLSFNLDGSGLSKKGGYTNAINVSMDSDTDISDSESEEVRNSEMLDQKSNVAIHDLTHNHSNSCRSLNIQLSREQSNTICDNDNIPHKKLVHDQGSISNTQSEDKVGSPISEDSKQKNEVRSKHIDDKSNTGNSYTKIKKSKSCIYESSS